MDRYNQFCRSTRYSSESSQYAGQYTGAYNTYSATPLAVAYIKIPPNQVKQVKLQAFAGVATGSYCGQYS